MRDNSLHQGHAIVQSDFTSEHISEIENNNIVFFLFWVFGLLVVTIVTGGLDVLQLRLPPPPLSSYALLASRMETVT